MQNPEYQGRIDQLNATIRRQFAEYDMLMESTGVCIVKVGTGDGFPVEWCNEAAYRAIGYTKEEYEARFGYDLRGYFRGRGEPFRILTDAAEAAQKNGSPRFQALVQLPSREHAFWAQCTGTFTDIAPETGLPASVYCVFTDVTPIVETKEKLVKADRENTRLSEVLNNIPAGVCVCTVRSGVPADLTVNRYLARHLGIRSGKYDIRDMEDVYRFAHAADRISLKKALNEFFENGTALDVICRLRQEGSGSFFWVRMEGRMIGQEDETKAAFLTCTDISTLKETEKTLREAVASAKLLVWEYDIPSHTIYLADNETSEEECRRFGIERVITGVPEALAEIVDERSMPELLEMYRKVEAGENASCEIWYKRMPGREPQCERVTYTVEKDEQGRAVRAYAVGFNITAEKKVAERYTRERSFLHDNRDFNLISKGHYNLTQNQVLEYSMQAEKTPGGNYFDTHPDVTYDEAAAALLEMPCPEEDRAVLEAAVNRQSLLRRYQEGHLLSRAQYRRLQKGDLPLWMSVEMRTYASPITGDVECFSYTYDITDKVRNERIMNHIAETEFDYVGLIFSQQGLFELLQKAGKIRFPVLHVKTPYADCCDYIRRHFVSDSDRAQFDATVALPDILAELERSGRCSSTYLRTEDGKPSCKQIDYSWLDRGERIILAVRTDISASYERDQQQLSRMRLAKLEAEQANEAKSAFLSTMSHDMRTPLNAVLSFADLALREEDPAVKQDYLQKVRLSGSLLLDLVNDTLELSRIESGKLSLQPAAVKGRDIWESLLASLRPAAEAKQIRLIEETPDDLDTILWTDRLKLQKVLLNLLSNAIKYTPPGGVVRVSVKTTDPRTSGGMTRRIVVEDNGIGISPAFLPQIFEPFAQEHRAEAGNVSGTGLGLSIVRRIVDLMGGTVSVQSKLNQGTRVTVMLPLPAADERQLREPDRRTEQISLAGMKVLICEDNDLNAEIITILLKEQKIVTDRAENGEKGLKKFADSMNGYYDAVLMDIRMPVLDGYEATKKMRALPRADAKTVPIIAMTADAFAEDILHARETGLDGYLTKPIEPEKLFRELADARQNGRKCETAAPE